MKIAPALLLLTVAPVLAQEATAPDPDPAPEGVEILMRRGGIPAVVDPVFVPGPESGLPDDAWILGVAIGDEAHAYSLNLLNNHEVVNDHIGDQPFAAVW